MERPIPTSRLITEVCGGNQTLVSSLHHGLYETPLGKFYSNLNFEDLVVFAANSRRLRVRKDSAFEAIVKEGDIYEVFNRAFDEDGFSWVRGHKQISEKNKKVYDELNPFRGHNLKLRLERVEKESVERLLNNLKEDPYHHVFEGFYEGEKQNRGGDNSKLRVMSFQNRYPESGKIVPAYAKEIGRILSNYPTSYEPLILQASVPKKRASRKESDETQPSLFD